MYGIVPEPEILFHKAIENAILRGFFLLILTRAIDSVFFYFSKLSYIFAIFLSLYFGF